VADESPYDAEAYRDFERAAWAALGQSYQAHFGVMTAQAADAVLDAVGAARDTRVLEVACGTGHLSAAAKARGALPVGIDFTPGMLVEARRLHAGIEFREGDAEALPFADAHFDAVVCSFGIQHFPHPHEAMAEARRVLVDAGRYAFTWWFPAEDQRVSLRRIVRSAIRTHGEVHGMLPPSLPELDGLEACRQALRRAGFHDTRAEELAIVGRWTRPERVLQTLLGGMGRTRALLEAQTPRARARIEHAICESARGFEQDGIIAIPMPAMLAWARK